MTSAGGGGIPTTEANLSQGGAPPQAPSWWRANWHRVAPWVGAVAATLVFCLTAYFSATGLLRQTHESYRQALVAWEASLRDDVRALRLEMNAELLNVRNADCSIDEDS